MPTSATLGELARSVAASLAAAGVPPDEARLDAELLTREALGWDRARWIAGLREAVPARLPDRLAPLVARRAAREPMAYLLGRAEFWGRAFEVTPAVLIPRPESELIIEQVLARVPPDAEASIVDVGTGSGCLTVTLAAERPRARVIGTDISAGALEVARRNAERHGVSRRVELRHGPLLAGVETADLIVSNPPYVPEGDRPGLPPEVREYEPAGALHAGADGLDVIRQLVPASERCLLSGGWLVFEFGFGQADAVRHLLAASGSWSAIAVVDDLQGIPRTALARRGVRSCRATFFTT